MDIFAYLYENNLYINLTNKCCNRCEFCIRDEGDGIGESGNLWLKKEPSAQEVVNAITSFDPASYRDIVFCGYGEPTYKLAELLTVCDYAHNIGKKTRLNTNGLGNLINKRNVVPDLVGKLDVISVSLNESNAEKYNALCHPTYGLKAYEEILAFTSSCVSAGIQTAMSVVRSDELDVDACAKVCAQTGASFRVRERI